MRKMYLMYEHVLQILLYLQTLAQYNLLRSASTTPVLRSPKNEKCWERAEVEKAQIRFGHEF